VLQIANGGPGRDPPIAPFTLYHPLRVAAAGG
ncbi:MAG: hypothetical protein ACI9HI_002012, partial [Salinirussus sp.]